MCFFRSIFRAETLILQHLWKDMNMQETEYINVYGARVHNLKDIDAEIPRNSLTVITGLLSLIHISEPTRLGMISYAVFCLKKIFFNDTATTEIYT